jgi:hypothetical protein
MNRTCRRCDRTLTDKEEAASIGLSMDRDDIYCVNCARYLGALLITLANRVESLRTEHSATMPLGRFQQLVNGPLAHPFIPFRITRLTMALLAVVNETGKQGAEALEAHCVKRAELDYINEEA